MGGGLRLVTKPFKSIGICTVFCYEGGGGLWKSRKTCWVFPSRKHHKSSPIKSKSIASHSLHGKAAQLRENNLKPLKNLKLWKMLKNFAQLQNSYLKGFLFPFNKLLRNLENNEKPRKCLCVENFNQFPFCCFSNQNFFFIHLRILHQLPNK